MLRTKTGPSEKGSLLVIFSDATHLAPQILLAQLLRRHGHAIGRHCILHGEKHRQGIDAAQKGENSECLL